MKNNKANSVERKTKNIRSMAAHHTFKKKYGQSKLNKEPEPPKCKVCNNGVLKRMQWNMLNCTNIKCNHSELQ